MIFMSQRPFRETKSYTAIRLAWDGLRNCGKSQTRGKKIGEPSQVVESGEGKGSKQPTRLLFSFTPFFAIFSPQRSLVLGYDPLGNNSSAARKSFGMSMQVAINKLDSLKA